MGILGTYRIVLAIVSTMRYIDCMFKLPDFPSIDFSKLDLDALRKLDLSKYVPAVNFPVGNIPKVDLRNIEVPTIDWPTIDFAAIDFPSIDVTKLTDAVRDAAYLTVGVGIAAMEQAREIADAARSRVNGLIRNEA
jgi:hypothetical protein